MQDYYFKTSDLTVGYNRSPLIKDINIGVKRGEIVTMIGPNGAGKSTILKSITKHLAVIAGDAYICDVSLSEMSYKMLSKQLSVVLTEKIKGELLTCFDVVATGRYPYTNALGILDQSDKDKIKNAMERAHVLELAERDFDAISDGQRQRVLMARAICQEPQIIVLDEPTSFLDIKHKLELLDILHKMAKEDNIAVIMSLHEIDLAQKISDKVICVSGDTIKYFGTPEEIFKEEIVNELYGIEAGSYNITFGSVELPKPSGEAYTFVIAGNGTGVAVFRELTKKGIPFYAGILHRNDVDYYVAKNLATKVFEAEPFEKIDDITYEEAIKAMRKCSVVIDAGVKPGATNARLNMLIEEARRMNILKAYRA